MEELQVVTFCTKPAGLLAIYQKQLEEAQIPLAIEPLREMPHNVGNLEFKLNLFRSALMKHEAKRFVFSDAWDVLFYGTKEEVIGKIPDGVICAAERNCWPDTYLSGQFPGNTQWRFFNGGLCAGTKSGLLDWLDRIERHKHYQPYMIDQQWFNFRVLEQDQIVAIDEYTKLFYCMMHERGELGSLKGIPINTICNTRPNFIHFNAKTDPTLFLAAQRMSLG